MIRIGYASLRDAVQAGVLSAAQAERLWQFLQRREQHTPNFRAAHILYYLGGLLAIGAMSLFMTLGWERFGGAALFALAALYAVLGLWLAEALRARQLLLPSAICAALVVALTPLAVYGAQQMLGWWPAGSAYRDYHRQIDGRWLLMELATLVVGALLLWRYRRPFLVLPLAFTLWYVSMDLAPWLHGGAADDGTWRQLVSLQVGLLMLLLALWVDLRSRRQPDFAFWLYLFGGLAFWGGLSLLTTDGGWHQFLYGSVNLLLIALGALLQRRIFVVLGGFGSAGYLGYLSYQVFADSWLFPLALTALGLAVVYAGILWQRHELALAARLRAWLPASLRSLLEQQAPLLPVFESEPDMDG